MKKLGRKERYLCLLERRVSVVQLELSPVPDHRRRAVVAASSSQDKRHTWPARQHHSLIRSFCASVVTFPLLLYPRRRSTRPVVSWALAVLGPEIPLGSDSPRPAAPPHVPAASTQDRCTRARARAERGSRLLIDWRSPPSSCCAAAMLGTSGLCCSTSTPTRRPISVKAKCLRCGAVRCPY